MLTANLADFLILLTIYYHLDTEDAKKKIFLHCKVGSLALILRMFSPGYIAVDQGSLGLGFIDLAGSGFGEITVVPSGLESGQVSHQNPYYAA